MQLEHASGPAIQWVALRMRDADFREFEALSTATGQRELAAQLAQRFCGRDDVLVARHDERPIAVGGLIGTRPNVASLLFFATDEFSKVGNALTRIIKRELFPGAKAAGVHRIEAVAMVEHVEAHRWIQYLGLTAEGPPLRGFGKGGEAYQMFSWVRDDL